MTSTILDDLAFLDAVVRRIGPERVRNVSTLGGAQIHPADPDDGHEIAAELGLALDQGHATFVTFRGDVDGHLVDVFASYRPTFEYVVLLDSNPAGEPGGASFSQYLTAEDASEHAKSAYGHVRWEQSGADEYAFTDRNGRRGYVVVRPYLAEEANR